MKTPILAKLLACSVILMWLSVDVEAECGPPDLPLGGNYIRKTSDTVIYECNKGLVRFGDETRKCEYETWTGSTPFCDEPRRMINDNTTNNVRNAILTTDGDTDTCMETKKGTMTVALKLIFPTDAETLHVVRVFVRSNGSVKLQGNHFKDYVNIQILDGRMNSNGSGKHSKWATFSSTDNKAVRKLFFDDKTKHLMEICEVQVFVKSKEHWCSRPPQHAVENGHLEVDRSHALLRCDKGYGGPQAIVCQKETWMDKDLICEKIICNSTDGEQGRISGGAWLPEGDGKKFLKCRFGYRIFGGPDSVVCEDGTWTATTATCTVDLTLFACGFVNVVAVLFAAIVCLCAREKRRAEETAVFKVKDGHSTVEFQTPCVSTDNDYESPHYYSSLYNPPPLPTSKRPNARSLLSKNRRSRSRNETNDDGRCQFPISHANAEKLCPIYES